MPLPLQINSVYTFSTYAPTAIGAVIKNAKLLFSCSFEIAMRMENVEVKYRAVYPVLEIGAPESPVGVIWHRFLTESGEEIFIAEPWIVAATLNQVTGLNFSITVVNASSEDRENVRRALSYLGVDFAIQNS